MALLGLLTKAWVSVVVFICNSGPLATRFWRVEQDLVATIKGKRLKKLSSNNSEVIASHHQVSIKSDES